MQRPQPPENLLGLDPEFDPIDFEPAPELRKWILETFVYEDGSYQHEADNSRWCIWCKVNPTRLFSKLLYER